MKNEPFTDYPLLGGKYSSGQYTYKIYHLASKVPAFIRILLPKNSLEIHEEAWNAYPYCKTVITVSVCSHICKILSVNIFIKRYFDISIESRVYEGQFRDHDRILSYWRCRQSA